MDGQALYDLDKKDWHPIVAQGIAFCQRIFKVMLVSLAVVALILLPVAPAIAGGTFSKPKQEPAQLAWQWHKNSNVFKVSKAGMKLAGEYTGEQNKSTLEYTKDLIGSKLPDGYWAQDNYMRTYPQGQGLGYMMSYAGGIVARQNGISKIFVSSGSQTGGQVLIDKLGGKLDMDFQTKDGKKFSGYVIDVKTMIEKAKAGFTEKGWELQG